MFGHNSSAKQADDNVSITEQVEEGHKDESREISVSNINRNEYSSASKTIEDDEVERAEQSVSKSLETNDESTKELPVMASDAFIPPIHSHGNRDLDTNELLKVKSEYPSSQGLVTNSGDSGDSHQDLKDITLNNDNNADEVVSIRTDIIAQEPDNEVQDIQQSYFVNQENNEGENLDPDEVKRITKIEDLISHRDWEAIGNTALSFEVDEFEEETRSKHDASETKLQAIDEDEDQNSDDSSDFDHDMVERLNYAVHAGDWAAVTTIAKSLKGDDDSDTK